MTPKQSLLGDEVYLVFLECCTFCTKTLALSADLFIQAVGIRFINLIV